ncbi:hypothetical protein QQZ08_002144 [Neonectria magnoliae]|uniref:Uncharacterized protein n=1 Tax=Neonectria magnoliae TaxID=2732573 RepID=A0ABR1IET2_9HYPO
MDWARDNVGLSESDLTNVFKYVPRESTIVHLLSDNKYRAQISSLQSDDEWSSWLQQELPTAERPESGLVLILAKRLGEPPGPSGTKMSSNDWLQQADIQPSISFQKSRATTFSTFPEKLSGNQGSTGIAAGSGRRGVRTLPFSRETFEQITGAFFTHSSIARVISRSDVPFFSSESVQIQQQAHVYNCRSSNAWDMDLALSETYFPERSLTFAILYGCTAPIEKEIIKRLALVQEEATHPVLMPGIFAELERSRHMKLVQSKIAMLETRILELDIHSGDIDMPKRVDSDERNMAKRTAWLDTTYLRNGLLSWNTQLGRMIQDLKEFEKSVYKPTQTQRPALPGKYELARDMSEGVHRDSDSDDGLTPLRWNRASIPDSDYSLFGDADSGRGRLAGEKGTEMIPMPRFSDVGELDYEYHQGTIVAGKKIKGRLLMIRDEYQDWIRDCTMRVDGMAMATQWAQGETNVEIALATKQDSRDIPCRSLQYDVF